ncbi:MAG: tripeptidyl peptidase II, partial [Verrucomicrobiota bacterium]
LEAEIQFVGVRADQDRISFRENDKWVPLSLESAIDAELEVDAKIDRAFISILPHKTEFIVSDDRHTFPPGPREKQAFKPVFLRQHFTVTLDKAMKIKMESSRRYDAAHDLTAGFHLVVHESGRRIYQGGAWRKPSFELPKGKTTIYRDIRGMERSFLEREKDRPFVYSFALSKSKSLSVYSSMKNPLRNRPVKELTLNAGRNHTVMIGDTGLASLKSVKPEPNYFSGTFKMSDGEDHTLLSLPIEYRLGQDFSAVANQKKKPASREKKKSTLEKYEDERFDRRLKFVRDTKTSTKADEIEKRDGFLATLLEERPDNPDLYVELAVILAAKANGLSAWHASKKEKNETGDRSKKTQRAIFKALKKARSLSQPKEVARFFGARRDVDDESLDEKKRASQEEKKMQAHQKRLATIARLKADVLLHRDKVEASRKAFKDVRRWESTPSENTIKQEIALLKAESHYALALQQVNDKVKKAPYDKKLLNQQIELYEKLDWITWADRIKLDMKIREHTAPLAY